MSANQGTPVHHPHQGTIMVLQVLPRATRHLLDPEPEDPLPWQSEATQWLTHFGPQESMDCATQSNPHLLHQRPQEEQPRATKLVPQSGPQESSDCATQSN